MIVPPITHTLFFVCVRQFRRIVMSLRGRIGGVMSQNVAVRAKKADIVLFPKGVYKCVKCAAQAELFVRVIMVACNQHGQMERVGK